MTWFDRLVWAEQVVSDKATEAVLKGWKWWRPNYSAGYYDGLAFAADILFDALKDNPHDNIDCRHCGTL